MQILPTPSIIEISSLTISSFIQHVDPSSSIGVLEKSKQAIMVQPLTYFPVAHGLLLSAELGQPGRLPMFTVLARFFLGLFSPKHLLVGLSMMRIFQISKRQAQVKNLHGWSLLHANQSIPVGYHPFRNCTEGCVN